MRLDHSSLDIVLITYPSGGGGHFLHKVLTDYFENTVKAQTTEISETGNAHGLKYVTTYHLMKFLRTHPGTTVEDYNFKLELLQDVDITGKTIVVVCDTGNRNDSTNRLLKQFPNAKVIRVYTPCTLTELLAVYNTLRKNNIFAYKNAIFDADTLAGLSDDDIVNLIVETIKGGFNGWRSAFKNTLEDDRVFNLDYFDITQVDTFTSAMQNIAHFLDTRIIDEAAMIRQYCEYNSLQESFKYIKLNEPIGNDDLVGRALQKIKGSKNEKIDLHGLREL